MPVNPTSSATPVVTPVDTPAVNTDTTSSDNGTAVIMPNVAAPGRVQVEGEDVIDKGDAAEIVIVHARVGQFGQGDRILIADLGPNVNLDRLTKLGAVEVLKAPAPQVDAAKPKK